MKMPFNTQPIELQQHTPRAKSQPRPGFVKARMRHSMTRSATGHQDLLKSQIPRFRRLTWYKSPALFIPKLKELLADAGVKFVIVRAPKGCSASGAVRVLSDDTPHIQLSCRYLSDDQFWFTLFHEIGHLLLHYDKMPILKNEGLSDDECEREANEFAAHVVVPMPYREKLFWLGGSRFPIIKFAKKVGIAPGLGKRSERLSITHIVDLQGGTKGDVVQPGEAAPHDDVSRRRVLGTGEIARRAWRS